MHDDAADELRGTWRCKEHLPVCAAAFLGRADPERIKSTSQRGDGLVRRQDPFSLCYQRLRDTLEIAGRHVNRPCAVFVVYLLILRMHNAARARRVRFAPGQMRVRLIVRGLTHAPSIRRSR